jgi:hypothetical protein
VKDSEGKTMSESEVNERETFSHWLLWIQTHFLERRIPTQFVFVSVRELIWREQAPTCPFRVPACRPDEFLTTSIVQTVWRNCNSLLYFQLFNSQLSVNGKQAMLLH